MIVLDLLDESLTIDSSSLIMITLRPSSTVFVSISLPELTSRIILSGELSPLYLRLAAWTKSRAVGGLLDERVGMEEGGLVEAGSSGPEVCSSISELLLVY